MDRAPDNFADGPQSLPQTEKKHSKGPWTIQEDAALSQIVSETGPNNWVRIAAQLKSRSAKQCRERYSQQLKPGLKKYPIDDDEAAFIETWVANNGKQWARCAAVMGGRSDNQIKNWWHGHQKHGRKNSRQPKQETRRSPVQQQALPPAMSSPYPPAPQYGLPSPVEQQQQRLPPPSSIYPSIPPPFGYYPAVSPYSSLPSPIEWQYGYHQPQAIPYPTQPQPIEPQLQQPQPPQHLLATKAPIRNDSLVDFGYPSPISEDYRDFAQRRGSQQWAEDVRLPPINHIMGDGFGANR